ncbi:nicotinate (nicotinamide) nucleotide adenylyltransferase [uncultured Gemmiger sp.]|uniref:nicotinate (nicotinamide) nucleotide adenylyltransferase n=1 Tax=uncultured Gemmiger sp. TaxID=1623490 RepID=UPI0025EAFE47|nr:nicotinate (nicotinamide) nucleotide adenylyltransferase [uncultured Gemmiger sp.]
MTRPGADSFLPARAQAPAVPYGGSNPPRILLYGGTFDPPHLGHMNNLRAAMAAVHPDRVVVMPAGIPPHKAASATPARHRLAMCRCFHALGRSITVSRWEMDQGGRSYTVNTLEMLRAAWPAADLYLAVGSDMLLTFRQWRDWQRILQLASLVVESRQTGDEPRLQAMARSLAAAGGRILFARAPAFVCASSDLRARLAAGDTATMKLLPDEVAVYIKKYNLYCDGK